jgi:hypothetical protein
MFSPLLSMEERPKGMRGRVRMPALQVIKKNSMSHNRRETAVADL